VRASYDYGCAHAPMLHRCPHAAHFRAHALANVDAKLRKSTYVIDPANMRVTCGQQLQVQVFPQKALSGSVAVVACLAGPLCCSTGSDRTSPCAKPQSRSAVVELTSALVAGAVSFSSTTERRAGAARCKLTAAGCVACRKLNKQHHRCKGASRFSGAKLSWIDARNEQPRRAPARSRHSKRP
jgi:hypothetical protein